MGAWAVLIKFRIARIAGAIHDVASLTFDEGHYETSVIA
jgi:hypothetical protein